MPQSCRGTLDCRNKVETSVNKYYTILLIIPIILLLIIAILLILIILITITDTVYVTTDT